MPDVLAIAAAYCVRVELADLGDWGRVRLVAEYDPEGPVIRVDPMVVRPGEMCDGLALAVAHELYHHREAIGEIPRIAERTAREAAADAFAERLVRAADPVTDLMRVAHRAGDDR